MTKRTEIEGVSTWTWGASAGSKNIDRQALVSGPGYAEGYEYDSIGRPHRATIASDATYYVDYAYNALGALDTLTYPTSTSGYRLKLQYTYQNGHVLGVRDYNAPSTVFWSANDTDARGSIVNETLGNGIQTIRGYDTVTGRLDYLQSAGGGLVQDLNYVWDRVGNLTQRQDVRQGITENFYYDNMHRLTSTTGPDPISVGYDARGNITSTTGNLSSGSAHTISWFSYNLPNLISSTAGNSSQFFYGPDRSRWKQVASYGGTSETTIYIGGLIEKVTVGGVTSWKHTIAGATGTVAVYTRKSSGTNAIHYVTKDHLGSVDSISNAAGAIEVRLSFGSLGQRRNEAGWSGPPTGADSTQVSNTTRRGFTEHEMLDNLSLIHMNGRVYDQLAGRFISPDPLIDGAGHTQGWNRYAYVKGRPLSFTDPSGLARNVLYYMNDPWNRRFEGNRPDGVAPENYVEVDGQRIRYRDVTFALDLGRMFRENEMAMMRGWDLPSVGSGEQSENIIETVVTTGRRIDESQDAGSTEGGNDADNPGERESRRTLCEAMNDLAATADSNEFLNGTKFDPRRLAEEFVPDGGGRPDNSHFRDARNGLSYDVQWIQVGWNITRTTGGGTAQQFGAGYNTVGGLVNSLFARDLSYFQNGNIGANMRGLQLGEFGAMRFRDFKEFATDLCPGTP